MQSVKANKPSDGIYTPGDVLRYNSDGGVEKPFVVLMLT